MGFLSDPNQPQPVRMPDDLPEPPTLADVQSYGVGVFCWCNRCHHNAVLHVYLLIAQLGPGLPFPMVHGRLRCQACGSKDIHARPNWKGLGVVSSHAPTERESPTPGLEEVAASEPT